MARRGRETGNGSEAGDSPPRAPSGRDRIR